MRTILIQHARRYPNWAIVDLYKLIHQAANGSEHALDDTSHVGSRLTRELAQLKPGGFDEPLLDPISADGHFVRIHLRPFVLHRLSEEALLQAFILTGTSFPSVPDQLVGYAELACQLAREGMLALGAEQISRYMASMQAAGFPAVHHSERYTQEYCPAYRVVAQELLPRAIVMAAPVLTPDERTG